MFRIVNLSLPWKALVAFDGSEAIGDEGIDEVAKSLIINPSKDDDDNSDDDASDDASDGSEGDTPDDIDDGEGASDDEPDASEDNDEGEGGTDDIDEIEVDVTVDGETKAVKLKDLKARYSGEATIDKRLQEVTEVKTKVINTGNALYQVLNEQAKRLSALDQVLKQQAQPAINWEELKVKDPGKYLLERDRQREAEDRQRMVAMEAERINAQKAHLDSLAYEDYVNGEVAKVNHRVPELRDPVKAKGIMEDLNTAASFYGLSQQELAAVVDHRHLMVLIDAAKYRKSLGQQPAKADAKKIELLKARPLVKAGTASQKASAMTAAKKAQLETLKRAKTSGSVDDVAKTLLVRRK